MKTALITGASSEIGISIARHLENNYNLILIKHIKDIDLTKLNSEPIIYECDFSDDKSFSELLEKIKDIKIDLLINVAALDESKLLDNINSNDLIKFFKINTVVPFMLIKNIFKINDNGIVINIASTDGIDTFNEYNIPYATSKSALIHLTKQLNYCYKKLCIYALCPNYVNTLSVSMMEPNFLSNELIRIKQKRLIEVEEVSLKVLEIINTLPNEKIIRMDDGNECK